MRGTNHCTKGAEGWTEKAVYDVEFGVCGTWEAWMCVCEDGDGGVGVILVVTMGLVRLVELALCAWVSSCSVRFCCHSISSMW